MSTSKCLALAFLFLLFAISSPLFGQSPTQVTDEAKTARSNLELQLNVIVASLDPNTKRMPQTLEPIVKQLRQTLPDSNYSLVATYTNRIKNGSRVQSKGMIASELMLGRDLTGVPSNYDYNIMSKLVMDGPNQWIEIPQFRFELQLPRIAGMNPFKVDYYLTGITTELSIREATPTVVGTLTTYNPNQSLVLVVSVRRAQ